jgi:phage gp45-like
MIKRANVLFQDNTHPIPQVQAEVTTDDVLAELDHYQPYGFASTPPPNSEALVAYVNGQRGDAICLVVTDASGKPFNQLVGEVAIYHVATGNYIQLKNDGTILSKGTWLHEGSFTASGQVADGMGTMAEMRTQYNAHVHGGTPPPTPLMS